jgi:putative ABC transport system permease protein
MRAADLFGPFLETLRTQRTRTVLTVLGIAWGTVAVVVLLAFGVGLERQMRKNARGIGDGVAIVFPGTTTKVWRGFAQGRPVRFVESDVDLVRQEARELEVVTPEYGSWGQVRHAENGANPYISGVEPVYGGLRNVHPQAGGRFINQLDEDGRRRVAVLGDELKTVLFGDRPAVGQQVTVNGVPFLVVGVMQKKTQNSSYQQRDKDRIFIPASTFVSAFGARGPARMLYRPADPTQAEAASKHVREILSRRYTFDPTDEDAVGIWDTAEADKFFGVLFLAFNGFLAVVGSFTLVVGGIGVANIMYVVVRERTREIGLRRALGARRHEVLVQFLVETFVIVGIGAVLGMIISVALVKAAAFLPIEEQVGVPTLSAPVMMLTLTLLGLVALLAGWFPARRAAGLEPVEALRY